MSETDGRRQPANNNIETRNYLINAAVGVLLLVCTAFLGLILSDVEEIKSDLDAGILTLNQHSSELVRLREENRHFDYRLGRVESRINVSRGPE